MKTLFPKQQEALEFLHKALTETGGALDASLTGTGKTVVACHLAKRMDCPVVVVCPKIVIPHWKRELEDAGVTRVLLVTNYEKLRRGSDLLDPLYATQKGGKRKRKPVGYMWRVPFGTLIIWDECHKCKAPDSQNSLMLVAAKQDGPRNLLLSATACQDPTEMRSIGYALGLHALNVRTRDRLSWIGWMKEYGCKKDFWHKWQSGPIAKLASLNRQLYSTVAVKLTPKDLPNAFAENHIITTPLAFTALDEINRYYAEAGVTPAIVDMMLDKREEDARIAEARAAAKANGEEFEEPVRHALVEMLRARQLSEAAKVPDIIEMVSDAVAEGYSAVVFVNFTDTITSLLDYFKGTASVVMGGQSAEHREEQVQLFQRNVNRVILCNTSAGGVGVSLHDTVGDFPRMSFISPTFNEKEYVQTLGRIHRSGAKSPATQRVLIASGTIEEYVLQRMQEKIASLDALHKQPN